MSLEHVLLGTLYGNKDIMKTRRDFNTVAYYVRVYFLWECTCGMNHMRESDRWERHKKIYDIKCYCFHSFLVSRASREQIMDHCACELIKRYIVIEEIMLT